MRLYKNTVCLNDMKYPAGMNRGLKLDSSSKTGKVRRNMSWAGRHAAGDRF